MTWDGEREYQGATQDIADHRGSFNANGPDTQRESAARFDGGRAARAVYKFFSENGPGTGAEATRALVPHTCATGSTVTGQVKWLLDHGWLRDTGRKKSDPVTGRNVRIVEVAR